MTKDIDQKTGLGKVCTKCGEWKLLEEFCLGKNRNGERITLNRCRACERLRAKQRMADPEYRAKKNKQGRERAAYLRANDEEWVKEKNKSNREYAKRKRDEDPEHRQKVNDFRKNLYKSDPEFRKRCDDRVRQWYIDNPEKKIEHGRKSWRKWADTKPEEVKAASRRARKKIYATTKGKLETSIRTGIYKSIAPGSKRGRKTFSLLGYTSEELRTHIESKFLPGMSWENFGKGGWHIDHIIPLAVHNYETPDDIDFKRAWSLTNLQPLWEAENLSKGAKLFKEFQPSFAFAISPSPVLTNL